MSTKLPLSFEWELKSSDSGADDLKYHPDLVSSTRTKPTWTCKVSSGSSSCSMHFYFSDHHEMWLYAVGGLDGNIPLSANTVLIIVRDEWKRFLCDLILQESDSSSQIASAFTSSRTVAWDGLEVTVS